MGPLGAIRTLDGAGGWRPGLRSAPQQPEGEGEGSGKKISTGRGQAPTGERRCASGARLVADWPPLLPPCVKTQMACCGWSEAPVS